jgi:hypothetical protein
VRPIIAATRLDRQARHSAELWVAKNASRAESSLSGPSCRLRSFGGRKPEASRRNARSDPRSAGLEPHNSDRWMRLSAGDRLPQSAARGHLDFGLSDEVLYECHPVDDRATENLNEVEARRH